MLYILGKLGVATVADEIAKELRDDCPDVVRAAALAVESLIGANQATSMIVEAAASAPNKENSQILSNALRWMDRNQVWGWEPGVGMHRNLVWGWEHGTYTLKRHSISRCLASCPIKLQDP